MDFGVKPEEYQTGNLAATRIFHRNLGSNEVSSILVAGKISKVKHVDGAERDSDNKPSLTYVTLRVYDDDIKHLLQSEEFEYAKRFKKSLIKDLSEYK